ncbi:MAG: hypothetical protein IJI83_04580 [Oscillospiraceae bacterium]|nr:hypothetical protein [Oscillospiraceae bacterium]
MDVLLNVQEEYNCTFANLFEDLDDRMRWEREQSLLVKLALEGEAITDVDNDLSTFAYSDFEHIQPWEREGLINSMWSALAKGFKKDYEDAEVDETLLEIKKKKTDILQKVKHLIQQKRLASQSKNT